MKCLKLILTVSLLSMLATTVYSAKEPRQVMLANQGMISGVYITRFRTKRIAAYLGIPYAQPPLDKGRFAPPEFTDLPRWDGVRNATEYAPDCMQTEPKKEDLRNPLRKHDELFAKLLDAQLEEPRKKENSEDCLYLNVYVPDGVVEKYPTIVWIHGGNFVRGSPNDINPFQFVLKNKVIFVTLAYRLNIFGFFSTLDNEVSGNFGLMDQVAALQWVQNNIEAFGGDKDNVCIFGHDAGAVSVGLHLIVAPSAGLFHKAIAMSGNVLSPDTVNTVKHDMITVIDKVAVAFGCFRKPTYELVDCLRRAKYQALLDVGEPLAEWKPIVDNGFSNVTAPFLPDLPSRLYANDTFVHVPILTGFTNMEDALLLNKEDADEGISQTEFDIMRKEIVLADITVENGSCFNNQHHIHDAVSFFYKPTPPTTNETILRKQFLDFYTDKVHGATTYQLAQYLSAHSAVYLYRFDLKPFSDIANVDIPSWIGVPHNFDLIFTFGLPYLALPADLNKWDYRDKSISEIIMKMWSNFAWYSNPTNSGVNIDWEPFEKENLGFLIIDRQNFTMSTPSTINYKAFEFWTDFYPKVVKIGTKCCEEINEDSSAESFMISRASHNILLLILTMISLNYF